MAAEIEAWKDIPGYEGLYQASDSGKIKSLNYNKTKQERLLKSKSNGTGYFQIELNKAGKPKLKYVHRLVLLAFRGDSELDADHINGIRKKIK